MLTGRVFLNGYDTNGDRWNAAYTKTRSGYRYVVLHNGRRVGNFPTYDEACIEYLRSLLKSNR